MSWFLMLCLGLFTLDVIIVSLAHLTIRFVKPRYPDWWERNIVANDPEDVNFPRQTLSQPRSGDLLNPVSPLA